MRPRFGGRERSGARRARTPCSRPDAGLGIGGGVPPHWRSQCAPYSLPSLHRCRFSLQQLRPRAPRFVTHRGRSSEPRLSPRVKVGVKIAVSVSGVAPGLHGFHVHAVGKCEGPEFKSAGGHFNPAAKEHGLENPKGSHAGDMPNLSVGPDGSGKGEFLARGASLDAGPGLALPRRRHLRRPPRRPRRHEVRPGRQRRRADRLRRRRPLTHRDSPPPTAPNVRRRAAIAGRLSAPRRARGRGTHGRASTLSTARIRGGVPDRLLAHPEEPLPRPVEVEDEREDDREHHREDGRRHAPVAGEPPR